MRYAVDYRITAASAGDAARKAGWMALEQSAELPENALTAEHRARWCGTVESLTGAGEGTWDCRISFPVANAGTEVAQFLNMLYGNISIGEGIRITALEWSALPQFPGPRFGIAGVREKLGIQGRPLSCTALKPVGLSAGQLGKRCFEFACGGLDIIKDDHGLADQASAPFSERLRACTLAVRRAFEETGHQAAYFPNVTADGPALIRRFEEAAAAGCTGVLISPHLVGLDRLAELRRHPAGLMLMAHPAFSGTLTGHPDHGLSHRLLYGELWRALGADFSIYPNTGGRFPYTPEICESINAGCRDARLPFKTAFPAPGGGINAARVPEWIAQYGIDTVMLIGGSLYTDPAGIREASRTFTRNLIA